MDRILLLDAANNSTRRAAPPRRLVCTQQNPPNGRLDCREVQTVRVLPAQVRTPQVLQPKFIQPIIQPIIEPVHQRIVTSIQTPAAAVVAPATTTTSNLPQPFPTDAAYPQQASVLYVEYIRRKYPAKYALIHSALLALINVAVIVMQVIVTAKSGAFYFVYAGFWGGGFNVIVGFLTFVSVCLRHYCYILFLSALHLISLFVSIIGLVVVSIFAINYYNNCGTSTASTCTSTSAQPFLWAIFGLGIASALLALIYALITLGMLNGAFSKRKRAAIQTEYMGNVIKQNEPFALLPTMNLPLSNYANLNQAIQPGTTSVESIPVVQPQQQQKQLMDQQQQMQQEQMQQQQMQQQQMQQQQMQQQQQQQANFMPMANNTPPYSNPQYNQMHNTNNGMNMPFTDLNGYKINDQSNVSYAQSAFMPNAYRL